MLKLSLIIPVYNEERHIQSCLSAIARQSVAPFEVIVVNNNCTDRTLEIAESFDFVTVVHESKQGLIHARNKGFNFASGDIIGRIDADSIIDENWVEIVVKTFESDEELYGMTGLAFTDTVPYINSLKSKIFSKTYFWFVDANYNTVIMWGANMALKKQAWLSVENKVILDDKKVHEDQDLSLWVAASGLKIIKKKSMLITTDGQSYRYLPKFYYYFKLYKKTKELHTENGNLSSGKLHKIGFWKTLPGRIMGLLPTFYITIVSIVFFPVDYLVVKYSKNGLR
jgi:glycosyltransferase involved in cell wall biosynthesis